MSECKKNRITRCKKRKFYPVLAKIRIKNSDKPKIFIKNNVRNHLYQQFYPGLAKIRINRGLLYAKRPNYHKRIGLQAGLWSRSRSLKFGFRFKRVIKIIPCFFWFLDQIVLEPKPKISRCWSWSQKKLDARSRKFEYRLHSPDYRFKHPQEATAACTGVNKHVKEDYLTLEVISISRVVPQLTLIKDTGGGLSDE